MDAIADDLRIKCLEQAIPKEWLDRNGHMNMQYYFGLVDRALTDLPAQLAIDARHFEPVRAQVQYRKELFSGQSVEVFARPLRRDANEIEFLFHIMRAGADPALSAECEVAGVFTDPQTGRPLDLSPEAIAELDRRMKPAGPKTEVPPSFEFPFSEEHWFESATGIVPDLPRNAVGSIGLQGHIWLFERGGMGMFAELNRAESVFTPGQIGGFALSSRIAFLGRISPGDRFRVRSRVCALGRKTTFFRHELCIGDNPLPAATSDHTMIFIDMTQRRSRPVPDKFKDILERRYGVTIPREA